MGTNVRGLTERFRRAGVTMAPLLFHKSTALHAMVTSAGYDVRKDPGGYDWHGLKRGYAEFALLQHTLAGEGRLTCAGVTHRVTAGQTMLLHFPDDNRYWLPGDEAVGGRGPRWEFFFLCVNGSEVLRAWRRAAAVLGPVTCLGDDVVAAAAQACLATMRGEVTTPGRASSLAYDLAMRLVDAAEASSASSSRADRQRDPAIQLAIDHCRANLASPLTVTSLAAVAGYSRFHFTRRFAASEATTPQAFIIRERVKLAARLLQSTSHPVKLIARRCGFEDPNYFCKVFRRSLGVSPGTFRRSGMYGPV
jgi:AraC family transcriptional regulator